MARFIGGSSWYLTQQSIESYGRRVGLIVFGFLLIFVAVGIFGANPLVYAAIMFLIVVPVLEIVGKRASYYGRRTRRFERGIAGEDAFAAASLTLGDGYTVLQDLHIPGHTANIDFVVVGPSGIYVVEVKNVHAGSAATAAYYLKEVAREYWAVHDYIRSRTGYSLFVTPVLAFMSPIGIRALGLRDMESGIHVMTVSGVASFISSQQARPRPLPDDRLVAVLRELR